MHIEARFAAGSSYKRNFIRFFSRWIKLCSNALHAGGPEASLRPKTPKRYLSHRLLLARLSKVPDSITFEPPTFTCTSDAQFGHYDKDLSKHLHYFFHLGVGNLLDSCRVRTTSMGLIPLVLSNSLSL